MHTPQSRRRSARIGGAALAAALFGLLAPLGASGADSEREMRSLDQQVQEIKSDVLGIANELSLLEERLLHPSNTQVAIFVDLADEAAFQLDAVRIQLNGEPVAHHIYSWKELEALRKGGVQRIYTGNVATGEHQLDVTVLGRYESGRDFSGARTVRFTKDVEPKLVGLILTGSPGEAAIELGDW